MAGTARSVAALCTAPTAFRITPPARSSMRCKSMQVYCFNHLFIVLILWSFDVIFYPFVEERDWPKECDDGAGGSQASDEVPGWAGYLRPHVDHWSSSQCQQVDERELQGGATCLWPMACSEGLQEEVACSAKAEGQQAVVCVVKGDDQSPPSLCAVQRQPTSVRGQMVVYRAPHYGWGFVTHEWAYFEI